MAVTREEVLHVARLARLRLEPEEVARFTEQLNGILAHIAALEEVEDAGDEAVMLEGVAPLRPDEPGADPLSLPPERLAPSWRGGFFSVPRLGAMDADAEADA